VTCSRVEAIAGIASLSDTLFDIDSDFHERRTRREQGILVNKRVVECLRAMS
jgi:hypothetical protein